MKTKIFHLCIFIKNIVLASSCLSVRLSFCPAIHMEQSAPTGEIFVEFYKYIFFFSNLSENSSFVKKWQE